MGKTSKKRGRPRSENPLTPAERMRAYRARKRAAGLKCVSEWVPVDSLDAAIYSDHRLLDARSLAMHCKIARKISQDQSLLAIPRRNLVRWRERASGEPSKFIAEWQDILAEPRPRLWFS